MKSTKTPVGSTDLWHARRVFGPKARASGRTSQVLASAALSADHFDPKASKAALSALVSLAQRHGEVRALDVEVVARKLAADAAESLRAMYAAVTELKQHGALSKPKQVETVTMADIDRLERGSLPPTLVKRLRRTAGLDLFRIGADPVRDQALRAELTPYLRRLRVPDKVLLEAEVPPDLTLRQAAQRQSAASLAILHDPQAPSSLKVQLMGRLGRSAGPEVFPSLVKFGGEPGEVGRAARLALGQIEKAQRMTIVLASMEVKPYSGTGGLSNVIPEMARAMAQAGHRVVVLSPRHQVIDPAPLTQTDRVGWVRGPKGLEGFGLKQDLRDGVEYWFLESDTYFSKDRRGIYGDPGDYADNASRYDFFSASLPVALRLILGDERPDVVHLNDAHTAAGAVYLRNDRQFADTATVLQVHNLGGAYQGRFGAEQLQNLRFKDQGLHYPTGPAEFYGDVNLLKLGLTKADAAITVSRRYKEEILTEEKGEGLHGVLRGLDARGKLYGSLNGIDHQVWSSERDPLITHHFSFADRSGKAACKTELLHRFGLPELPGAALVGVVARLTEQKGFDDIVKTIESSMATGKNVQFVISGDGDPQIRQQVEALIQRYPERVAIAPRFTVETEHQIYAGSDLFLMPSRFEPCGLPQMYSLRYLTMPIVRAVGGLDESIQDWDPATGKGNGFKFKDDLNAAFDRALAWYQSDEAAKEPLLRNAALSDFSWEGAAVPELLTLYRKVQADRTG